MPLGLIWVSGTPIIKINVKEQWGESNSPLWAEPAFAMDTHNV